MKTIFLKKVYKGTPLRILFKALVIDNLILNLM